jgi:hypothetical protein
VDHRQWEPAPEWLPKVLVDDAADCVPEAEQLLAANGLDDTTPAGHTAQGGPSSPEDEEPQVTGGLTPHPDSPLKDMASVVKDDDYRACWKFCLAEMRAELSGRKRCRDGYGPAQIRKRAGHVHPPPLGSDSAERLQEQHRVATKGRPHVRYYAGGRVGMVGGNPQGLPQAQVHVTEDIRHRERQAADHRHSLRGPLRPTEAAAQPPDERASIACNLFSVGSEAEPFDLAPATNPWAEHHDAQDRPFWFNATTDESLWEKPAAEQPALAVPATAAAVESAQPAEATQATTSVSGGAE